MNPALAPNAGLLGSAERRSEVAQEPGIHPGDADLDFRGDAMCPGKIFGPDRRRKAIAAVVGTCDCFLLAVERRDLAARAENFLANHCRGLRQAGPDGWL